MHIVNIICITVAFCLIPAGVLWLCKKLSFLGAIGPIFVLYIIGLIIGNIGIMPEELKGVQNIMANASVPLAIPLMLFSCSFSKVGTRSQILALVTGLIAVITSVIIGYLLFGVHLEEGTKIGGMLTGVYTGGTINLAALKTMLNVKDSTYILVNSYDILVCFLYFTFLLTVGIKLFRKILPHDSMPLNEEDEKELKKSAEKNDENPYKGLFTASGLKQAAALIGVALLICALSGGLALTLPDNMFMTVFILMLTTFGIIASFIEKIHTMKYSYDIGMYFIYIFCLAVASMADMSSLNLAGSLNLLGYLLVAVFGSLLIQLILAKIFKIDADMVVIASVAYINSPPFVPMIAAAMKNKNVLVAGLSIGIIGYAVGNYLGYLMSEFLKLL